MTRISVTVDLQPIEGMFEGAGHEQRLASLTEYALNETHRYVPFRDGALRASALSASQPREGLMTWSAPYARRQWAVPMHHTTPGTTDHWEQAMAAQRMGALERYAASLYR